jgi:hypothetical protein
MTLSLFSSLNLAGTRGHVKPANGWAFSGSALVTGDPEIVRHVSGNFSKGRCYR